MDKITKDELNQRIEDREDLHVELSQILLIKDFFKTRSEEIYNDCIGTHEYITDTIDELYETYLCKVPETLYQQLYYFIKYTVYNECNKFEKAYRELASAEIIK